MKGEQEDVRSINLYGESKDIYSTEDEHVIKSVYKDQATMLNGARKETIEGKVAMIIRFCSIWKIECCVV